MKTKFKYRLVENTDNSTIINGIKKYITSWEDNRTGNEILNDFSSTLGKQENISKQDFLNFFEQYIDDTGSIRQSQLKLLSAIWKDIETTLKESKKKFKYRLKETYENNELPMEPEQVKPGMVGEEYNGEKGEVIKIVPKENWKQLKKYDTSGWLDGGKELKDILDNEDYTHFIAVKFPQNKGGYFADKEDEPEINVYTYGGGGFEVYADQKNLNEGSSMYDEMLPKWEEIRDEVMDEELRQIIKMGYDLEDMEDDSVEDEVNRKTDARFEEKYGYEFGELDENKKINMKQPINELKRMQKIAGVLNEDEMGGPDELPVQDDKPETPTDTTEIETPDVPDEIKEFYTVTKPMTKEATLDDILAKDTIFGLLQRIQGGLKVEDIRGLFYSKPKASKLAKSMLKEFEAQLEEVEGAMDEFRTHKGELDKHRENAKAIIDKVKNIGTEEAK